MKQLAIGALALVVGFFAGSNNNAQSVAPPAKDPAVVDLSKPLPKKLTVTIGHTVVFENGPGKVYAKETDGKGTLFQSRPHNQSRRRYLGRRFG